MAGNEVEIVISSKDKSGPGISGAQEQVSRFRRAVKDTGGAADESSGKVGKYGERIGALGEKSDNSERNLIGLHDVVDGTAAIMAGPGKAGIAAYIQGWADLAGGAAPLLESMKNLGIQTIKNTLNSIRNGVVQTAVAIKTRAMAAAQWLLNAAMSANPIGLVIIAIVGLITILVLAYKHSETFRRIVQGAFRAVTGAASAAWGWIREHWPLLLAVLTGPIGVAVLLIVRNWDRIRSGAAAAWNAVVSFVKGIPGRILGALGNLGRLLYDAGKAVIQGLIDGLEAMVGKVGDVMGGIASKIKGFLPFSPAKEGPLAGTGSPYHGGRNIARMVAQGLQDGRGGLGGAMGGLLGAPGLLGAGAGAGGGAPVVLEIRSGGSRLDDLLVEILRGAIRVRGGDVQLVLGR